MIITSIISFKYNHAMSTLNHRQISNIKRTKFQRRSWSSADGVPLPYMHWLHEKPWRHDIMDSYLSFFKLCLSTSIQIWRLWRPSSITFPWQFCFSNDSLVYDLLNRIRIWQVLPQLDYGTNRRNKWDSKQDHNCSSILKEWKFDEHMKMILFKLIF